MYYKSKNAGISFWRYSPFCDENTWTLQLGFGGPARRAPREGYLDPLYRFQIRIEWRPLATCFEWWCDQFVGEHGWPVNRYRIHGFRRWPIAVDLYRTVET